MSDKENAAKQGTVSNSALIETLGCDTQKGGIMNKLQRMTYKLAQACDGNPAGTTIIVMLFFVMFSVLEITVEKLIFGVRFEHLLDPVFQLSFIGYSAYAVYWCAVFNGLKQRQESDSTP